ncbi:hypothetical protein EC968_003674, partial [Mortierella alpina]
QAKAHPWLQGLDWADLRSMPASFVPVLSTPMDTSYFDDFSNPEDMAGYRDVMLRDADLQDAEEAEEAEEAAAMLGMDSQGTRMLPGSGDSLREEGRKGLSAAHGGGPSNGSLPSLLRVQDPWRGAFVGFTFRHPLDGRKSPETHGVGQQPPRVAE